MRIDKAEVIVTSPDRNFVTLKLTTDDGLTGLGDATLNGRELSVVSYLKDHVATHNKPSTAAEALRHVETKIKPGLGKLKINELTRADVKRWHEVTGN